MTQSVRKAISRFRKLQDKVFNQQAGNCTCCDIMMSNYDNGVERKSIISIYLHISPRICEAWTIRNNSSEAELEKIFREASEFINYQI